MPNASTQNAGTGQAIRVYLKKQSGDISAVGRQPSNTIQTNGPTDVAECAEGIPRGWGGGGNGTSQSSSRAQHTTWTYSDFFLCNGCSAKKLLLMYNSSEYIN